MPAAPPTAAQGASRLTPRPREAPRGAAEGPSPRFLSWSAGVPHAGGSSAPLRSAPQRGKGWGSKGLETACCGPCGGFDTLTCIWPCSAPTRRQPAESTPPRSAPEGWGLPTPAPHLRCGAGVQGRERSPGGFAGAPRCSPRNSHRADSRLGRRWEAPVRLP